MTDDLLRTFAELNPVADPDRLVAFDAPDLPADPVLRAVLEHTPTNGEDPVGSARVRTTWLARMRGATETRNGDMQSTDVRPDQQPTTHRRPWTLVAGAATAAVMLAAVAGVVLLNDRDPAPVVSGNAAADDPGELNGPALLNRFLEARVAGEGAQEYLSVPEEDVPLLYATSSGAPYEQAEFEPVTGIDWPYGFAAFKVRLFAGDTVVEQLFFMPQDDPEYFPADGRLRLEYQWDGFGTDIAPTTEDGQPVALPYTYFDGQVTLHAAHPWVFQDELISGSLMPEGLGVGPTTDGGQRHNSWDELVLLADPGPVDSCPAGAGRVDAETLAASIQSHPDIEATVPVVVRAGSAEALMMDVKIAAGASICAATDPLGNIDLGILRLVLDQDAGSHVDNGVATGFATGEWMRLYLFDVPEGSTMRLLAMAIVAPESRFERAVEAAAPVVDSVEFHAP